MEVARGGLHKHGGGSIDCDAIVCPGGSDRGANLFNCAGERCAADVWIRYGEDSELLHLGLCEILANGGDVDEVPGLGVRMSAESTMRLAFSSLIQAA